MGHPAYQLDWNLVRTFVAVVNGGSLAAAARQLGLSHPTVARHIQLLEESLGLALFERSAVGLKINESGTRLAETAVRMQKTALDFEAASDAVKTNTVGTARITVAEVLAELFPDILRPLQDAERIIELVVSNQSLNLLERESDIAIRHVRPVQAELVCRRVGSLSFAAFASAAYVAEAGLPTLDDLDAHHYIDGVAKERFLAALAERGHDIPTSQVVFRTDSLLAQRRAAQASWGVAGLPVYLAEQSEGLVRVLEGLPVHELDVWIVARQEVRHTQLLKQVYDHVAGALGEFLAPPLAELVDYPR